jgi:osmoprotectant transport system ATP-binding protein
MYRFVSVFKSFGKERAVNDLSFATPAANTTVLIGPSGSGKSTIFGLMTGLLKPESGTVFFADEPLTDARLPAMRQRIGYVIQEGGLFPHLTARANVTLMARHLGWTRPRIDQRIDELLALTRLSADMLARYPAEISGGQRQRVSLMRALMLDAEVLLLDEPLGALDPMVRAELRTELAAIFQQLGKTVILVTHDLAEAAFFSDQIILMRDGRIVQTGSIRELADHPSDEFVRRFVVAQESPALIGAQS